MQKKLIALAIAGLASTAAFAQSNVTIYGVVDASVDVTNAGDSSTLGEGVHTTKISSNQSRIGFKGSEDLGDGLKAVFQLETAFNTDGTTASNLNSRNTFVGLASDNWGRVILGRYDTPYKTSTRAWDLFGDHLGDNRNLMGGAALTTAGLAGVNAIIPFDNRASNTVRYDSPNWGGFNLAVAYVDNAEAVAYSAPKSSEWSVSGSYAITSEWSAIAAYEKHFNVGLPALTTPTTEEKAWKVGASFKTGPFQASAIYEKTDDDFATSLGHKAWTVSGGYSVTTSDLIKLAYTKAGKLEGPFVGDTGAKQWAVGYDHTMSKRTKLYAEYVKLKNESGVGYGLTGAGLNTTGGSTVVSADSDPSAFSFGVRHAF
jgi:predicted porin